jgi:hypothetical protein
MKARSEHEGGPSIIDGRARLAAVDDEPRTAAIDGRLCPWQQAVVPAWLRAHDSPRPMSGAPSIAVTIGSDTRVFCAFVTAASVRHDAPSTITLYSSTVTDLAGFAAEDLVPEPSAAASPARLVLVDAIELSWQRARYREAGHRLFPAGAVLAGPTVLQRWLWRRLVASQAGGEGGSHGTDSLTL